MANETLKFQCKLKPYLGKPGCGYKWEITMTRNEINALFGTNGTRIPCPKCDLKTSVSFEIPSTTRAVNNAIFGK